MSVKKENIEFELHSNDIEIVRIQCDNDGRNAGNIIIEMYEDQERPKSTEGDQQGAVQDPELVTVKNEQASKEDSCDTMDKPKASNEGPSNENNQTQFLTLESTEVDEIDDIPHDVFVYTCQPLSQKAMDCYPCKSCGKIVGCIFCLKSHYESVHLNLGLIQYKCDQTSYLKNYTEICHKCNLVCEGRGEMIEHRKIHFVTCDVCDMSFDSALFLSNHCKTMHDKFEVIISCDLCEQWFKRLQDLSIHYQVHHTMILCIVCFKRFSNVADLTHHHGTHKIVLTENIQPVLPYACSKCNEAFNEISELSSHLVRYHPNRKVYGSIARKRAVGKVKSRKKEVQMVFDDCGGLSTTNVKKLKINQG